MLRGRKRKNRRMRLRALMVLAFLAALLAFWGAKAAPTIRERLTYQAKVLATAAVNQAVEEELARMGLSYHQLLRITRDGAGRVLSIEADTVLLSRVKTSVTQTVSHRLEQLSRQKLTIPLGSLTGSALLAGRGPSVTFRLTPESAVDTNLFHQFTGAGVNQTMHRVYLAVDVSVAASIPGFWMETAVSTDLELAQTVIVGEVPEFFVSSGLGEAPENGG